MIQLADLSHWSVVSDSCIPTPQTNERDPQAGSLHSHVLNFWLGWLLELKCQVFSFFTLKHVMCANFCDDVQWYICRKLPLYVFKTIFIFDPHFSFIVPPHPLYILDTAGVRSVTLTAKLSWNFGKIPEISSIHVRKSRWFPDSGIHTLCTP